LTPYASHIKIAGWSSGTIRSRAKLGELEKRRIHAMPNYAHPLFAHEGLKQMVALNNILAINSLAICHVDHCQTLKFRRLQLPAYPGTKIAEQKARE
jgi:hypothetical protein